MQSDGSGQRGRYLGVSFLSLMTFWRVLCSGCCVVLKCIKVWLSGTCKVLFKHFSWSFNGRLVVKQPRAEVWGCSHAGLSREMAFQWSTCSGHSGWGSFPIPFLSLGKPCSFPGVRSWERGTGGGWNLLWYFCQEWRIGPKHGKTPVQWLLHGKMACHCALSGGSQINL